MIKDPCKYQGAASAKATQKRRCQLDDGRGQYVGNNNVELLGCLRTPVTRPLFYRQRLNVLTDAIEFCVFLRC